MGYATRAKRFDPMTTTSPGSGTPRAPTVSSEELEEQKRLRNERIFWTVMVLVGGLLAWACWAVLGRVMSATAGPGA